MKGIQQKNRSVTPLSIIALFVSLTEAVLGLAVVKTSGGIQVALTSFVILFPLIIAGAFFSILWNRPYVLYPPKEYGDKTDVSSYVKAMERKVLEKNALYSDIKEIIQATLISDDIINELSSPKDKDIRYVLNSAANKTLERIQQSKFITIDSRLLLERNGKVWQIAYEQYSFVSELLDNIWYSLQPHAKSYLYGRDWILCDSKSGQLFKDMGRKWTGNEMNPDMRSLKEVGIISGMKLNIINPVKLDY